MPRFKVTITTGTTGSEAARGALGQAGVQLHPPGWGIPRGEAPTMTAPELVAEVEAEDTKGAARRVSEVLASSDYRITAEPF